MTLANIRKFVRILPNISSLSSLTAKLPWLLLLFGFFTGCGSKTYPAEGKVVFADGTPAVELAGYFIMFQSLEHKTSATGTIQPDGSFAMGTMTSADGAMLGKQRVAITPPPADVHKPRPPSPLPARYGSFETSGIEVEIKPETNQLIVTVERTKK